MTKVDNLLKTQTVKIVIDESEKGEIYILGIMEVNPGQESYITRKFDELRKDIKTKLLHRKPNLSSHPKLMHDLLPELHGVELANSSDYYRHNKNPNPKYWREHFVWYEEALRIIKHVSPKFYFLQRNGYLLKALKIEDLFTTHRDSLRSSFRERYPDATDASFDKFESVLSNPYVTLLPKAMVTLDRNLAKSGKIGKLICDNKDECKGFSNLALWETLKNNNVHKNLSQPDFLSSSDEPLVQAIDLIAYVAIQLADMANNPIIARNEDESFKQNWYRKMYSKYIHPFDCSNLVAGAELFQELEVGIASNMASELAYRSAGFSRTTTLSAIRDGWGDLETLMTQNEPEP